MVFFWCYHIHAADHNLDKKRRDLVQANHERRQNQDEHFDASITGTHENIANTKSS